MSVPLRGGLVTIDAFDSSGVIMKYPAGVLACVLALSSSICSAQDAVNSGRPRPTSGARSIHASIQQDACRFASRRRTPTR